MAGLKAFAFVAMLWIGGGLGVPGVALAQTTQSVQMGCITLAELRPTDAPPRLARSVRSCVADGRYEDAIRVFLAYSSYGIFDQQRVSDESGHAALVELHLWIFSGYPKPVMEELRSVIAKVRDRDSDFFKRICANLARVGPPDYRPTYLIERGMQPRKTDADWLVEGFDVATAWRKSLVEINGCSSI